MVEAGEWPKVLIGDIVVIAGEIKAAGWTFMPEYGKHGYSYHTVQAGDLEPAQEWWAYRKNEESK